MRKTVIRKICLIMVIMCAFAALAGCSYSGKTPAAEETGLFADDPNVSVTARGTVRVGCFRGEDYYYWNDELKAMGAEMYNMGLISNYQARNYDDMEETWAALCSSVSMKNQGRLKFIEDAFYTLDAMDETELDEMLKSSDIDLMLTFGTSCGKYLTEHADEISYDYMVYGATNTIATGIVKSETERFNDKSFSQLDPGETRRILEAAYDIYHFEDIGVVYQNDQDAFVYSGIDSLEAMSELYGFKIHRRYVNESSGPEDDERFYTELKAAYDELMPEIDTLFITVSTIEDDMLPSLIDDMIDNGIVTIAQDSSEQCKAGALMHVQVADSGEDGRFMAETIDKYCSGTPITKLDMIYVANPKLFLNYETIKRTGVKIPMRTYLIADTIFTAEDMQ